MDDATPTPSPNRVLEFFKNNPWYGLIGAATGIAGIALTVYFGVI